jgi:ribonuclease P protein component
MLDKFHRFHGLNALSFAYKRGQVLRGGMLSLKYVRNDRRSTYRVAVVVSKKVDKSAVVRNRIRRRIFEIVRLEVSNSTGPYDLVFTAYNPQLAELPTEQLRKLIHDQLKKAAVLS